MKLITAIYNSTNFSLIGFEAEGKELEFGGKGKNTVTRMVHIDAIVKNGGIKGYFNVSPKGLLVETGNFKVKNLPACLYSIDAAGNESFTRIDNKLTLINRVAVNGKLAGFDVRVGNITKRLRTEEIINLARCMQTNNFNIRRMADGSSFIAGKPGFSLDTLPMITLSGKQANARNAVKTINNDDKGTNSTNSYDTVAISRFCFLNMCDTLNKVGGKLIFLPGDTYKKSPAKDTGVRTGSDFVKDNIEFKDPVIKYSETTVNVNINFQQMGRVAVDVGGYYVNKPAFVYRGKSIFKNGKVHHGRLGIAVKTEGREVLEKEFGRSLSLSVVDDPMTLQVIRMCLDVPANERNKYEILLVDTSRLSAMNKETAEKSRMTPADIRMTTYRLMTSKNALKYVNKLLNEMKQNNTKDVLEVSEGKIWHQYRDLTKETLDALSDIGVDIYTGEYKKVEKDPVKAEEAAKAAKEVSIDDVDASITFKIDKLGSVYDYTKANDRANMEKNFNAAYQTCLGAEHIHCGRGVNGESLTVAQQYKELQNLKSRLEKDASECRKKLWLNNFGAYTLGGYKDFELINGDKWQIKKTNKGSVTWVYMGEDAPGLQCNISGNDVRIR